MSSIKVISFDLDNTLWDVNSVIHHAEKIQRAWLTENAPAFVQQLQAEDLVSIRNRLLDQKPELIHDLSKLRQSVLGEALEICGYSGPEAQRLAQEAFQIFFHARHDVTFYADVPEVLAHLSKQYVLGALSNGNADIHRVGLERYFSFSFSAATVGVGKPAPDMFQAALHHTKVEPHQMIHVGDHPVDDIQGAAELGIHTLWINHTREPFNGVIAPSAEVHSFRDLQAGVETIATLNH